jgi:hypothetical protein
MGKKGECDGIVTGYAAVSRTILLLRLIFINSRCGPVVSQITWIKIKGTISGNFHRHVLAFLL